MMIRQNRVTAVFMMMSVVAVGHDHLPAATGILVLNSSFEDVDTLAVGGIWPEADTDPVNADAWLEPGPVSEDMNAFPPELIPPGFLPPDGATLDTGVFFNAPVNQDPVSGDLNPNPSFVTNADGNQLAYLFAKDDLQPGIGFIQHVAGVYEYESVYAMTVAVGKSFFVPPIGGSHGDPTLALRFLYTDEFQEVKVVAETVVSASTVLSTELTDFTAWTFPVQQDDPWQERPIGIGLLPLDGDSGAWILDDVRLRIIPEPSVLVPIILALAWGLRSRKQKSLRTSAALKNS